MENILTNIVQMCTVGSVICGVFYKATLQPMNIKLDGLVCSINEKVEALGNSVDKLNASIDKMNDKLSNVDVRLARVEESTKSAHHRLDALENDIKTGR